MSVNQEIVVYGVDLEKTVFHIVALNNSGLQIVSKKLQRNQSFGYFAKQQRCRVAMEACAGAYWIARKLVAMGPDVMILPAQYVKSFTQSRKTMQMTHWPLRKQANDPK